ncbi:MAG: ribosome maturation factor RimM [Endomicrobiia bacterium]
MEVCIGKVLRTKGLKGEIIVKFFITNHTCKNQDILFFEKAQNIYGPYQVEYLSLYKYKKEKKFYVLKLKEINSLQESLLLRGSFIIKNFEYLPEYIFFKKDIVNSEVILKEKNLTIGRVVDIIKIKDNYNVLSVMSYKNKEIIIPFIKEVVLQVDVQNRIIFVDSLDGALESYIKDT